MAFYATAQVRRLARFGDSAWSMADQAILSGLSFLTMFTIGRWGDAGELGRYAIAISLITLFIAMQDALVTRPYAVQILRPVGSPPEHAFSSLLMTLGLAAVASGVFAISGFALRITTSANDLLPIFFALAMATPAVLLRESIRRLALANLLIVSAFVLDASIAALIVAALAALVTLGNKVDAGTVLLLLSATTAFATLVWILTHRTLLKPQVAGLKATALQSWKLGKWLLPTRVAMETQGYATHWIAFLVAGAATTGVYAACLSIVALTNPFLIGYINVMTPRAVRILQDGGMRALRRKALDDAALLGATMGLFVLGIFLFGRHAVAVLYPSISHESIGHVITILAMVAALAAIGAPAANALASAERGKPLATITVASSLFGIGAAAAGMWLNDLVGAAYGILVTELLGCAARWRVFNRLVAEDAHIVCPRPLSDKRKRKIPLC